MEVKVEKLSVRAVTDGGEKTVVSDLSFDVAPSRPLAIVGESGSGKTMSALAILGLLPENCDVEGSVDFGGVDLLRQSERKLNSLRGSQIVYVPQSGADFLNPSLKIRTQMYESLAKNGVKGRRQKEAQAVLRLNEAGLQEAEQVLNKYPFQISGGQAQRVVLALSLVGGAKLLIADEPTKGIDRATADKFLSRLEQLCDDVALIVITHDIAVATRFGRVLVMKDGKAQDYGDVKSVFQNPSSEYTKRLISAALTGGKIDNSNAERTTNYGTTNYGTTNYGATTDGATNYGTTTESIVPEKKANENVTTENATAQKTSRENNTAIMTTESESCGHNDNDGGQTR